MITCAKKIVVSFFSSFFLMIFKVSNFGGSYLSVPSTTTNSLFQAFRWWEGIKLFARALLSERLGWAMRTKVLLSRHRRRSIWCQQHRSFASSLGASFFAKRLARNFSDTRVVSIANTLEQYKVRCLFGKMMHRWWVVLSMVGFASGIWWRER